MLHSNIIMLVLMAGLCATVVTSQYVASAPAQAPTLLVYGSENSVTYKADYNITIQSDSLALEEMFARDAFPAKKGQKEFYVSQYVQDTWVKAHQQCKSHNMRLATFDSVAEYETVNSGLEQARVKGEFWVSAARLAEPTNPALFIPTFEPVAQLNNGHYLAASGVYSPGGACVFYKVDTHAYSEKFTWHLGECNNPAQKKYFICEKDSRPSVWFQRV